MEVFKLLSFRRPVSPSRRCFFSTRLFACEFSTREEQLWDDLFANSSHWWDNRHDKLSPSFPDFRHKVSRCPLWLNSPRVPLWVLTKLASVEGICLLLCPALLRMFHMFCELGQVDMALHVLLDMPHSPTENMYYSLLKACNQVEALAHAKLVRVHMSRDPLATDGFLGEYLVITLAKCGDVVDALSVFHSLSDRTVFSWTAIISGFAECGKNNEALSMYHLMHQDGIIPNAYTFVSLLKACRSNRNLQEVEQIHREASIFSFEFDLYVGTSLIEMYGKCGSIELAKSVFDSFRHHNVVSWTVMSSAYVENGRPDGACQLYNQMQRGGVSPDDKAIVVALQACCMLAENHKEAEDPKRLTSTIYLTRGLGLHLEACIKGFDLDVFVCNSLISLYGACERISDAECVFEQMPCHDVVSWNALLSAYVERDFPSKALKLYRQSKDIGIPADERTFVSVLLACGKLIEEEEELVVTRQSRKAAALEIGRALHSESRRTNFYLNLFVGHTTISMYGNCGSIGEAENAFHGLIECNAVAYNVLSLAYIKKGEGEMVLQIYKKMHDEGLIVNDRTFVNALQACCSLMEGEGLTAEGDVCSSKLSVLAVGKALHVDAQRMGFESDASVSSCLLSVYEKCGSLLEAKTLFSELSHKSIMAWNTMLFALIGHGEGCEALLLFKQMQEKAVTLTTFTLICALQASSMTRDVEACEEIHFAVVCAGEDERLVMANTLIHAYGCDASMADALAIFDRLPNRDVASWNVLIGAYAQKNKWAESLHWFEKMQATCMKPDGATFSIVLSACRHTGLVEKGMEYLVSMGRDYNLAPDVGHYDSIIESLAHAGDILRLEDLISSMPVQPDLTMWLCLLGSCQMHGNKDLGKLVHENAVKLQTKRVWCSLQIMQIASASTCNISCLRNGKDK
ncbi:hypothetical protein GOP47_0023086 [Adiantum capillus-veneris]|uniref:Pentatricopeptide repeat-containing protein n=1 Tax=Adiantum capillus-veneris TaxID=13818 RepID=A0A9D4U7Q7_ADICA|nr:hypothetical protein GOP47_0023086 [Adiantum capillus-veneris]